MLDVEVEARCDQLVEELRLERKRRCQPGRRASSQRETVAEAQFSMTARYLDVDRASDYLSRCKKAVYHLVSRREIPFIKQGRRVLFDRLALDRWMERKVVDCDVAAVFHSPRPTKPRQKREVG